MGSGIINRFGIKIFVLLVLLLCLGSGYTLVYPGLPPLPAGQGWQMTFDDEFDGNSLDTTKWSPGFQVPWCPGCTGTESLKRISVSNGILTMYPTLIPGVNGIYKTSVTTYNLFEQRYGYFETRFKTTAGNGLWSGFWLLPHSLASFKADHREIDIFENLGYQPDKIYMSFWEKKCSGIRRPRLSANIHGPGFFSRISHIRFTVG